MTNPISIVGTIATDPKRFTTQSGVVLCSFRVASGDRRFDRVQQKWVDGDTNWFSVTAFRSLAEHAVESFKKGERIIVSGRLRIRSWEKDGKSGMSAEIEADAIGHDLRWGVSRFEKRPAVEHAPQEPAADSSDSVATPHTSAGEPSSDGFVPLAA